MAELSPVLFEALAVEAQALKVIDTDILRCHPDITDSLTLDDSGKPDPEKIKEAVKAIREKSPRLFKETRWEVLADDKNPTAYLEQEKAFRESLRTSHRVGVNPFKSLDSARLSPDESRALTRHLQGRGDSVDRSILSKALSRQISENSFLGPEGVA